LNNQPTHLSRSVKCVEGISGIVGGLTKAKLSAQDFLERFSFFSGLLSAGAVLAFVEPRALGGRVPLAALTLQDAIRLGIAGFLVGVGTARGNGEIFF
jgi:hypothetical protein